MEQHRRAGRVVRTARWSAEHPWRAVLGWVAFVALCLALGGAVGTREQSEADAAVGEWGRAERIVESGAFAEPATENVLITPLAGELDPARAEAAAADATARLAALPDVAAVGPPVPAADGRALLVPVEVRGDADDAGERVGPLLDATAAVQAAHPDLRVEQVGGASIDRALEQSFSDDFRRAELLSIPVTLVILVVAFGALLAAAVPVLLALSSVAAALGLSALVSQLLPTTDSTASVVLLIGMAVGVDYSLFLVRRAREERARGATPLAAVAITAATSGRAVVVSGVTVAVAMAGMLLSGNAIFTSLGIGAILVVAVAVLGSVTVLPAVLAALGPWVDRPRVPLLHRLVSRPGDGSRLWSALLRPALRRPLVSLLVGAGALVALAVPALGMTTALPGLDGVSRDLPTMQAYDRLAAAYPAEGSVHVVAVRAPAGEAAAVEAALRDLAATAGADPRFAPSDGAVVRSADGAVSVLEVPFPGDESSPGAQESLQELRTVLVPQALGGVPGAQWAVGGETAASVDFSAVLSARLPWVIAFVLALTFVLVLVAFRSVVVAATAIVLNLLSVGAAYGLLTLVFEGTWAEGLLDFRSTGAVVAWLPLFLFVVLFGLSMDYHVFVVSRIREAALRGMPTVDAVRHGIVGSAGTVTSASSSWSPCSRSSGR